jgi:predicted nucleic acid-binding protein
VKIVLDASAALEVALNRKRAAELSAYLDAADEVLAPELFVPEVLNAIWKLHHFGNLSLSACDGALEVLLEFIDTLVSNQELHREAFLLSRTTRRPAYDMFYLALAKREDAALMTLDNTLRKQAVRQGIRPLNRGCTI